MLAVDLGGRTTKAVLLQRSNDESYVLSRFAILDAPIYEKSLSGELLGEHLKILCQSMEGKSKYITLTLGVNDAITRLLEMPQIPISDMRQVIKMNTKNYLQQDLPGHVFDCFIIPPRAPKPGEEKKPKPAGAQKFRVLVAGARRQLTEEVQTAVRNAGLMADCLVPGIIGPVNVFERAQPEAFSKEVVALVDIGFKSTTVSILQEGELLLSRVVTLGGDRLTSGLADSLGISYAEAEGIKVGMPMEVSSQLESFLLPLGRDLRASIDFFEHQYDTTVGHMYISGASASSEFIVQHLQSHLMMECKTWNPLSFLQLALPPQQMAEVEHVAPQLGVAVGAALAAI
jgi:type IV pilus assembly protein PilM